MGEENRRSVSWRTMALRNDEYHALACKLEDELREAKGEIEDLKRERDEARTRLAEIRDKLPGTLRCYEVPYAVEKTLAMGREDLDAKAQECERYRDQVLAIEKDVREALGEDGLGRTIVAAIAHVRTTRDEYRTLTWKAADEAKAARAEVERLEARGAPTYGPGLAAGIARGWRVLRAAGFYVPSKEIANPTFTRPAGPPQPGTVGLVAGENLLRPKSIAAPFHRTAEVRFDFQEETIRRGDTDVACAPAPMIPPSAPTCTEPGCTRPAAYSSHLGDPRSMWRLCAECGRAKYLPKPRRSILRRVAGWAAWIAGAGLVAYGASGAAVLP